MRKTKIVCTLGPSTDDDNILRNMILSGMSVARINMSHGNHEDQKQRADQLKKIRTELDVPVALLLDTRGPEIRTGKFKDNRVYLKDGQTFTLTTNDVLGDENMCSVSFKNFPEDIKIGNKVLIDDGLISMDVVNKTPTDIICTVTHGGTVSNNKGINAPGCRLSMPFISERDKEDIAFGVKEDFDFIAASFVRSKEDVFLIRQELQNNNCEDIRIISKIENSEGVNNIDEIIRVSDGIMVARGDMGVELNLEDIPIIQKDIIAKVYTAGKQVITATQMLESMVSHLRPTRAEATDVANAIYDGTSAIMLSGETAAGNYPVEAVKTMALIANRAEEDIDFIAKFQKWVGTGQKDVTSAISHATCTTAHDLGAVAIMTASKTGQTARMISKYRPSCPIISGSSSDKVLRQMNMSWGVVPLKIEEMTNSDKLFDHLVEEAQNYGLLKSGDIAVITAGMPLGISGTTNMLKVHLVGDILVEGEGVGTGESTGRLCVCVNEDIAISTFKDGDILVLPFTTNKVMPLLRKAKGIITEESGLNTHAAVAGLALDIPTIIGAKNACELLKSGTTVTLDSEKGIVLNSTK